MYNPSTKESAIFRQNLEQVDQIEPSRKRIGTTVLLLLGSFSIIVLVWFAPSARPDIQQAEASETQAYQQRQNITLIEQVYADVFNHPEPHQAQALFSTDFLYTEAGHSNQRMNVEKFLSQLTTQRTAFYELHYAIDNITLEGEWVAVKWQATGTPLSSFQSHPPTGQALVWHGITIWQIADGKIIAGETVTNQPLQIR